MKKSEDKQQVSVRRNMQVSLLVNISYKDAEPSVQRMRTSTRRSASNGAAPSAGHSKNRREKRVPLRSTRQREARGARAKLSGERRDEGCDVRQRIGHRLPLYSKVRVALECAGILLHRVRPRCDTLRAAPRFARAVWTTHTAD
eukprot:6172943-Pleurochrysis_carterae.AAC.2